LALASCRPIAIGPASCFLSAIFLFLYSKFYYYEQL
jgi:hypothetical protein